MNDHVKGMVINIISINTLYKTYIIIQYEGQSKNIETPMINIQFIFKYGNIHTHFNNTFYEVVYQDMNIIALCISVICIIL